MQRVITSHISRHTSAYGERTPIFESLDCLLAGSHVEDSSFISLALLLFSCPFKVGLSCRVIFSIHSIRALLKKVLTKIISSMSIMQDTPVMQAWMKETFHVFEISICLVFYWKSGCSIFLFRTILTPAI